MVLYHVPRLAAALLCALSVPSCAAAQEQNTLHGLLGVKVPIAFDPPVTPHIVVQVSVNGGQALPFIVDTGAGVPLLVSRWAATKLKLPVGGRRARIAPGNATVVEAPVRSVSLVGGSSPAQFAFNVVYVLDREDIGAVVTGQRIAGILGLSALAGSTVQIDFAARTMSVYVQAHRPIRLPGASNVAMAMKDSEYYVTATLADGTRADLLVDTGAEATALDASTATSAKPSATSSSWGATADGSLHVGTALLLPALRVGDVEVQDVAADVGSATLGLDVLKRFRVTFDFPNCVMALEPRTDAQASVRREGWAGMHTARDRGGYRISYVWARSPAAQAGAREGDLMIAIDGRDVCTLAATPVTHLLNGIAGTNAVITMQRARKRVRLTIRRADRFAAPPNAFEGVRMSRALGGVFVISVVRPGSSAASVGLQSGDRIMEIDRIRTAGMSPETVRDRVDRPQVVLSVMRAGRTKPITLLVGQRGH